ncbi:MAG: hypothetical protein WCG99_03395 [Candidatus Berkelbacteria bacterium]
MHFQTPLVVDFIVGLIWAGVLVMMLVKEELQIKYRTVLIAFWAVTGAANLVLGIIPALPEINWLPILYLVASVAGVIVVVKKKP